MSQADDSGAADGEAVPDYPGLLRLDGRRFLVLGAGQGTGRQAAHALASVGARVACVDLEADRAATVAAEVDGLPLVGDMSERADVERVVDETSRTFAGLDGIVDIIGMARYSSLLEMSDEEWDWHFDVVLRHAYLAAQVGGRVLSATSIGQRRERRLVGRRPSRPLGAGGGTLVFVASVSGLTSAPRHAAYGAAKAGLMSLTRTAAVELGPAGVRVNAVAPGVVWTPRVSVFLGDEGRARNEANAPLRRIASTSDIAAAILFLCSDLAAFVTGQTLVVDGGVSAKFPYPMAEEAAP
jgi:NAD(P)-dependent dehydrogenase (short-subunit alcohol dehydrogenase family)